jgi:NTE family protein
MTDLPSAADPAPGTPRAPQVNVEKEREYNAPVLGTSEEPSAGISDGIGLCLSGGGFRAMLFHVGSLWRLCETGWLERVARISSVSGGAIAAAVLGIAWDRLRHDGNMEAYREHVETPLRRLASNHVGWPVIGLGLLLPGGPARWLARAYRRSLFDGATLQDLPEQPGFFFNATNSETGSLFRFSRFYAADHRLGLIPKPVFLLADVVAASSAFPPLLAPFTLRTQPGDFTDPPKAPDLLPEAFYRDIDLVDGGVYDNLGLETVWKNYRTVLVSDGGQRLGDQSDPPHFLPLQLLRVLGTVDHQVRMLRRRHLFASYYAPLGPEHRDGAYWGIRSNIENYHVADALPCPEDSTLKLAGLRTAMDRLSATTQERLINWGYAICDAALRRHVDATIPAPVGFPYPNSGV